MCTATLSFFSLSITTIVLHSLFRGANSRFPFPFLSVASLLFVRPFSLLSAAPLLFVLPFSFSGTSFTRFLFLPSSCGSTFIRTPFFFNSPFFTHSPFLHSVVPSFACFPFSLFSFSFPSLNDPFPSSFYGSTFPRSPFFPFSYGPTFTGFPFVLCNHLHNIFRRFHLFNLPLIFTWTLSSTFPFSYIRNTSVSSLYRFSFSSFYFRLIFLSLPSRYPCFSPSPFLLISSYPFYSHYSFLHFRKPSYSQCFYFFFSPRHLLFLPLHLSLDVSLPCPSHIILPSILLEPVPFPSVLPPQRILPPPLPHLSCPRGPCSPAPEHNAVPPQLPLGSLLLCSRRKRAREPPRADATAPPTGAVSNGPRSGDGATGAKQHRREHLEIRLVRASTTVDARQRARIRRASSSTNGKHVERSLRDPSLSPRLHPLTSQTSRGEGGGTGSLEQGGERRQSTKGNRF
ncbi:hypothetical protein C7M84_006514 [Penaeus vannamei]|uniref:Uncharacterized protein n=1 Tax=Penaeus vannamei TaxID=6689 RepID=A0A3R7M7F1_PENVA|nr:hypothetical protein C7M84_006514 [Penaeus vannamei]